MNHDCIKNTVLDLFIFLSTISSIQLTLETIVPIKIELSTMDFEPRISGTGRDQDANCARPLTYFQLDPTNSKCCFKNESF